MYLGRSHSYRLDRCLRYPARQWLHIKTVSHLNHSLVHPRSHGLRRALRWRSHCQVRSIQTHTVGGEIWRDQGKPPGQVLKEALELAGKGHLLSSIPAGKTDLSYLPEDQAESSYINHGTRMSVPVVLAEYIEKRCQNGNGARRTEGLETSSTINSGLFSTDDMSELAKAYLSSHAYNENHLQEWYQLLSADDANESASRILAYARVTDAKVVEDESTRPALPHAVFLFFLRRNHLSPAALRDILRYTSFLMRRDVTSGHSRGLNLGEITVMIPRLLRHARQSWPEAMPAVGQIFIECINRAGDLMHQEESHTSARQMLEHLNFFCNRILRLLALPSPMRPYNSVNMLARAQFDIIRHMTSQKPALMVNREGYQAVARVQLANKKTDQERDWASLKAASWPPWKEDKTGLDQDKDYEYGTSRAQKAIEHSLNAGYEVDAFGQVAGVLAGWNVDRSPTIQTRHWLLGPSRELDSYEHKAELWAARIQATRNIHEAWSCFLACEKAGLSSNPRVYLRMFQKLDAEEARIKRQEERSKRNMKPSPSRAMSGDGIEVSETPRSPKERVYVQSSPPTSMDELAEKMHAQGITPTGHCLVFLVGHATSLSRGIKYLQWAQESEPGLEALYGSPGSPGCKSQIPLKILTAFLKLLCRNGSGTLPLDYRHLTLSNTKEVAGYHMKDHKPLTYALQLLRIHQPFHRPAFIYLLEAISLCNPRDLFSSGITPEYHAMNADIVPRMGILKWSLFEFISREISSLGLSCDVKMFNYYLRVAEKAILAAKSLSGRKWIDYEASRTIGREAKLNLRQAMHTMGEGTTFIAGVLNFIRSMFYEIFGASTSSEISVKFDERARLPEVLASPEPYTLRLYVSLLAAAEDWGEMLLLVKWIVKHKADVEAAVEMPANGWTMIKRLLFTIREVCESQATEESSKGSHDTDRVYDEHDDIQGDILAEIFEVVEENLQDWGGWPSDEAYDVYQNSATVWSQNAVDSMVGTSEQLPL
ncbi:MAG: hypothetical protein M1828_003645 [Chrysothrix sp. TS-e1954]|nr:MAG: hypothetical protein M1828_003645 [Chrysothrix sp. TS-e1954]